jgi:hypothetical protein
MIAVDTNVLIYACDQADARRHGTRPFSASGAPQRRTDVSTKFRRPKYLFSGLTKCGACGTGFVVYSREHLGCFGARGRGICSNRLTIPRQEVEEPVLRALQGKLMRKDGLLRGVLSRARHGDKPASHGAALRPHVCEAPAASTGSATQEVRRVGHGWQGRGRPRTFCLGDACRRRASEKTKSERRRRGAR